VTDDEQEQSDSDVELLKAHVAQLMEHFESIHIFATRHMPAELDGTVQVQWGGGNWFARYGQIKSWTIKQDEDFRVSMRPEND
jgi:hypothetical protein